MLLIAEQYLYTIDRNISYKKILIVATGHFKRSVNQAEIFRGRILVKTPFSETNQYTSDNYLLFLSRRPRARSIALATVAKCTIFIAMKERRNEVSRAPFISLLVDPFSRLAMSFLLMERAFLFRKYICRSNDADRLTAQSIVIIYQRVPTVDSSLS